MVEATRQEIAAACRTTPDVLDVSVVEVVASDGPVGRAQGFMPLARIVNDPPGGPGPAVRVFMDTREMEDATDGSERR